MSSEPRPVGPVVDAVVADPGPMAISLQQVSKCYQIYDKPQDRLKQSLVPRIRYLLGRKGPDYYRNFWALRDISLEIRKGETIGIIGRNGSGKSTLLQLLCGTLAATSGRIRTRGRIGALLELGSGFNPEFTGRENVFMNGMILGLTHEQVAERYEEIVAFADIGAFIDQPVKTYSSGMYVRLAFAVIAHVDAEILVIDEALSVGDVFFGQKCMRFLRRFQESGTVIFVSHDASAVTNLCDRAVLLEAGRIRMEGPAKQVCEAYHASLYDLPVTWKTSPVKPVVIDKAQGARAALIERSTLRNDIEVFSFDVGRAGFGDGSASIVSAALLDGAGDAVKWVVGGEAVVLRIEALVHRRLRSVIMGFFLKDRLGQTLFGENTYLAHCDAPLDAQVGAQVTAEFKFSMPILPKGHYSFDVAIADGTHLEHRQAEWIHDAVVLESHSSSVSTGLVGIPFEAIRLSVEV